MTDPRLIWTGTDETNRYHDEERGRIYWASDRPLRVPPDAYEEYLEEDGWEEPPDPEEDRRLPGRDSESVRDARVREQQEQEQEQQYEDDDVRAEPATEVESLDSNSDGDADTQAEQRDFDASEFVDNDWREVEQQIQSGEYDQHLGEIERAERNREGSPREASVLGAIKDRRNAPLANTEEDPDESDDSGG